MEIEELAPRVVLAMLGDPWRGAVLDALKLHAGTHPRPGASFVTHVAQQGGTRWLFTERPERRTEQAFAREVGDALRELGIEPHP